MVAGDAWWKFDPTLDVSGDEYTRRLELANTKLRAAGVPVRVDRTDAHMHHKFAVFDRELLLTGSYNWTRSAANQNYENIIVTDDARLATTFANVFEQYWDELE